jgi:hypothetical protein
MSREQTGSTRRSPVLTAPLSGGPPPCHVRTTAADVSSSVRHCLLGSVAEGSRHAVTYAVLRRVGDHRGG